nr:protein translocase subunit SecD [Nakamurella aerolata]
MVFFTPGSNAPKLGIDLQGGTRVTLGASLLGGGDPPRESMQQARVIMENRVNGSGVAGAQVQVDGARQLVVTVPGTDEALAGLTRSAILNIRPVVGQPVPDMTALPDQTSSTGATTSGPSSSFAETTRSAVGETLSNPPPIPSAPAASAAPPTTAATAAPTIASGAPTSGAAASGQGLRPAAAATSPAPSGSAAAPPASSAPASAAAASGAPASSAAASGPASTAASSSAAPKGGVFPAGSDPKIPIQPQGNTEAAFTAWQTAAAQSLASGQLTCKDINDPRWIGNDDPEKPLLACGTIGSGDQAVTAMYVLEKTLIPGSQIDSANAGPNPRGNGWVINMQFDSTGAGVWATYTAANIQKQTAFTLDGEVLSAPAIQAYIPGGQTEVSGDFTQQSATQLANALKFGSLPLKFTEEKVDTISAEVGSESLVAGLIAGGIGLLLVVIYCLIYYRMLGVITVASLILSGILVYAVMVLLGRWIGLSLDMAGVAGLIIAIGITADSFVVYFERLKDEVREGRSFRSAVPRGWARAKRTILSADAVTFLSAVILYVLAVGDVKGFAFTLGLSTVLDLVVVFLVTHPAVALAADSRLFRSAKYSGLGAVAEAGARHRAATSRLVAKEA